MKSNAMIAIAAIAILVGAIWSMGSQGISLGAADAPRKNVIPPQGQSGYDLGSGIDGSAINVMSFGAKGDGVTNDTDAIQAAINSAAGNEKTVFIPPGTYRIDAVRSIRLKNGITIQMTPETILSVIPNSAERYAALTVDSVENVRIRSGILLGDRQQHLGRSGEWGMGIRIIGSKNILIQGTVCNEFWGDGLYIAESERGNISENIRIVGIKADQNRRQGISLISGRNIEIIGSSITNTYGTAPAAGIDLEPNNARNILDNITITDLYTAGNNGAGILISTGALAGAGKVVDIKIINHQDDGSDRGMQISSKGIVPGRLVIENADWRNAQRNAIAIQAHDHRSFNIEINQPRITNANQKVKGAAIDIYSFRDGKATENGGIGNVTIKQPEITDANATPNTLAAFHIWDIPGHQVRNLAIIDPILKGSLAKLPIQSEASTFIHYTKGQP